MVFGHGYFIFEAYRIATCAPALQEQEAYIHCTPVCQPTGFKSQHT